MKLPWYKNIEHLLKLDDIYHIDHVSAHEAISNNTSHVRVGGAVYDMCVGLFNSNFTIESLC